MSAVITEDRRNEGGTLVENAEFFRFAHHHGFRGTSLSAVSS